MLNTYESFNATKNTNKFYIESGSGLIMKNNENELKIVSIKYYCV